MSREVLRPFWCVGDYFVFSALTQVTIPEFGLRALFDNEYHGLLSPFKSKLYIRSVDGDFCWCAVLNEK